MIFHHHNLPQCTTSVKLCQTGFSYKIAIQKWSVIVWLAISLSNSLTLTNNSEKQNSHHSSVYANVKVHILVLYVKCLWLDSAVNHDTLVVSQLLNINFLCTLLMCDIYSMPSVTSELAFFHHE